MSIVSQSHKIYSRYVQQSIDIPYREHDFGVAFPVLRMNYFDLTHIFLIMPITDWPMIAYTSIRRLFRAELSSENCQAQRPGFPDPKWKAQGSLGHIESDEKKQQEGIEGKACSKHKRKMAAISKDNVRGVIVLGSSPTHLFTLFTFLLFQNMSHLVLLCPLILQTFLITEKRPSTSKP